MSTLKYDWHISLTFLFFALEGKSMELASEGIKTITLFGQQIHLLPQKALYYEQEQALILADPHFGKTAHFRKSGIPIPNGADESNYQVLDDLLINITVLTVYFLGDLFHSGLNKEWATFAQWMQQYPQINFYLIQGNHDILPVSSYQKTRLVLHPNTLQIGPFLLSHKPLDLIPDGTINLAGHIHPGIHLRGKGRQTLKLPCFYWTEQQMILPAFGHFTGTQPVAPAAEDRIFGIGEGAVRDFSIPSS